MDIQKEVEKFEAKKSKLVSDFVQRLTKYVNDKYSIVAQIDKTVATLEDERSLANKQAEEARQAIREIK